MPSRVLPGWTKAKPSTLELIGSGGIIPRKGRPPARPGPARVELGKFGVMMLDESHTLTPDFIQSSRRADAVEFAPPVWTVALSATPMGNRDVDWLAHLVEKRASLFLSPDCIAAMDALHAREASLAQSIEGGEGLSPGARVVLSDRMQPFIALRRRSCIGESADRTTSTFPVLAVAARGPGLGCTEVLAHDALDAIVAALDTIASGSRRRSATPTRFGPSGERYHGQTALHVRNLINLLRADHAGTREEMRTGAIGRALRDAERQARGRAPRGAKQLDLFEPEVISTPPCEAVAALLDAPALGDLDAARDAEMLRILDAHGRVVVLAERIDTLLRVARACVLGAAAGERDLRIVIVAAENARIRAAAVALRSDLGPGGSRIEAHHKGEAAEELFGHGGRRNDGGRAVIFLTYAMAEGINLQSTDALVVLGLTPDVKHVVQGLGRIGRIDSPHAGIRYYAVEATVGRLASDAKVARRIHSDRALSGAPLATVDTDPEPFDLQHYADHLRLPRAPRAGNVADQLGLLRDAAGAERIEQIERLEIQGLWGAELALLDGPRRRTILHVAGRADLSGLFAPPRLLVVDAGGVVLRNQAACARLLREAFE